MSRIGKKPVAIPSGVTAEVNEGALSVKGPKGTLTLGISELVEYRIEDGQIAIIPANDTKAARSHWGMQRTMVSNLVEGVSNGFTKVLNIKGVGYRASTAGRAVKLQLGFSHDVDLDIPEGLEVKVPDQTTIEISGIDKQKVGQFAAEIREWRKPEPYKGKGVAYKGEFIFRKEGKKK